MKGFFLVIILTIIPRFESAQLEATSLGEIAVLSYILCDITFKSIRRINNQRPTIKRITLIVLLSILFLTLSSFLSAFNGSNPIIIVAVLARISAFFYILSHVQTLKYSDLLSLRKFLLYFSVIGLLVMIYNFLIGIRTGSYGLGFYSVKAANLSGYIANSTLSCFVLIKIMQSFYKKEFKISFDLIDAIFIASVAIICVLTLSRTAIIVCSLSLLCLLPCMTENIIRKSSKALNTLAINKICFTLPVIMTILFIIFLENSAAVKFFDVAQKMFNRFGSLNIDLLDFHTIIEGVSSTGRFANKVPEINKVIEGFNVIELFTGRGLGYSLSWSASAGLGGIDSQIYATFIDTGLIGMTIIIIATILIFLGVFMELSRLKIRNRFAYLTCASAMFNFAFLFTNEFLYLLPSYAMAGFLFGFILWMKKQLSCLTPRRDLC